MRFHLFSILCCLSGALYAQQPNVIYLLADDLGYGDLSCYGQEKFQTPNLDSLAAEGIQFFQHYAGSTACAPSRCSLLTGKHTGHTVVRSNTEFKPEGQAPMHAETYTLGHMFQESGYTTGVFGKWGLGAPDSVSEPLRMGFDRFYGYNCQRIAHHYYPYYLWNDEQREMLWGNVGLERGEYAPDLIQDQALEFIENNKDKPFFLYYSFVQPHAELAAPEKVLKKYRGKFGDETPYIGVDDGPYFRRFPYGSQSEPKAAYAAMIDILDEDVGQLMAKLEELGISENTIVVFASDNGPHKEGGNDPSFFDSTGGKRGMKRELYEGGINVPMLVKWPAVIEPGRRTKHVSAFWDVMPTFAQILGVPVPEGCDGLSFLPILKGVGQQPEHDYLYWEFHKNGGSMALRKGPWKVIRLEVATQPDRPLELYNLELDPREKKDVSLQHPEVLNELERLMKAARVPSSSDRYNFPVKPQRLGFSPYGKAEEWALRRAKEKAAVQKAMEAASRLNTKKEKLEK